MGHRALLMSWAMPLAIWPRARRRSCCTTDLLGAAQFIVGLLRPFRQAHLVIKALAFLLGGEDFDLQGLFFQADGGDFRAHLFGFMADLLQNQHDHAHGDEELQHRRHEEPGAVEVSVRSVKG